MLEHLIPGRLFNREGCDNGFDPVIRVKMIEVGPKFSSFEALLTVVFFAHEWSAEKSNHRGEVKKPGGDIPLLHE